MKKCPSCGKTKSLDRFYVRDTGKPSSWCKGCIRTRAAEVRATRSTPNYNPDVDVWSHRLRRYGLTRAAYDALSDEQGGLCAICRCEPTGKGLCVDHDHVTKKVRGLLCNRCNWALGHMRDNPDYLNNAITYLHHGFVPPF
jgi:Autographiviridae endonuclease VII